MAGLLDAGAAEEVGGDRGRVTGEGVVVEVGAGAADDGLASVASRSEVNGESLR